METTVQIVEVNSKEVPTPNGRNPTGIIYNIKASDGRVYSTWKKQLANTAGELRGQTATIAFDEVQRGEFTNYNLKSVQPASGQAVQTSPVQVSTGPVSHNITAKPVQDKDEQIAKAVALKAAVETVNGGYSDKTVISLANEYLAWLLGPKAMPPFADRPTTNTGEAGPAVDEPGFTETEFPF